MNNSLKILLTINLVGTIGAKKDNLELVPYSYNTDEHNQPCEEKKGIAKHKNRVESVATQNMKLSQDTYDMFISGEVPAWSKPYIWDKLNTLERVRAHCARLADGNEFTFEILES